MSVRAVIVGGVSLALYRRYRPETFAEVIGQEHVTGPLQQALRNNRVAHAYLFSGPRGCGKTTSARILARCLNCEQGPTPEPCGECRSCRDLARGGPGSIDVIEIDAASHGNVDDTRDLREKAFFGPAASRYKIYIIDEAHMVSTAGFNALLKVVEEPPEHLKFIFATTEPEKVIGTIRSRTHHYPFRLVPPATLRDYLAEVCTREQIQVEEGVFPLVVRAGAGSVRDSMSVMDQLLAGAGEEGVTYAMATALLGYTDAALLDELVDAFAAQDGAAVFRLVERVVDGGHDPRRFAADLLERLRDLVILSAVPDAGESGLLDAPADRIALMEEQAGRFGAAELGRAADIVNTGLTEMRGATSPRLQLELICARVLLPGAYDDERSLQARLEKLERRAVVGGVVSQVAAATLPPEAPQQAQPQGSQQPYQQPAAQPQASQPAPAPAQETPAAPAASSAPQRGAWPVRRSFPPEGAAPTPSAAQPAAQPVQPEPRSQNQPRQAGAPRQPEQAPQPQQPPQPSAPSAGIAPADVRRMWPSILDAVKGRRRVTWMLAQQAQVAGFDGSTLQLSFEHAGTRDGFVNGGHDEILRQAIQDALGASWRVECIVNPSGGGGAGGSSGSSGFGGTGSGGNGGGGGNRPGGPPQAPGPSASGPGTAPTAGPRAPQSAAATAIPAGTLATTTTTTVTAPAPSTPAPNTPTAPVPTVAAPHIPAPAAPPAPTAQAVPAAQRPPAAPPAEYDVPPPPTPPEDDDLPEDAYGYDDDAFDGPMVSGHDLIVSELAATVIEEITHD
jgi:DNA polymerase-3 subunit gamma/tau